MVKELVDIDVPSQELAEKNVRPGIEVEGAESPAAGLSKLSSVRSCLAKMCQKLTFMFVIRLMSVKKKPVNRLWCPKCACRYQGHGGTSGMYR